ncbi:caspase family protein [Kribbella sp. VKM Ac-2566]|uniref:caspase family protein n=1 Tax=Kribbella sp. VKM Ac-2566 TaxID=2512218 RepID=UPI001062893D|nr:caspase family protein [Kribbella sp. VKM Ac-2566]TDW79569.1 caspase domain-containing protein [Kribbella sp. VKM Ac-2566]
MDGRRRALIVANDEYDHDGLRHLRSPAADAEALGRVLGDGQIGAFDVETVRNEPSYVIQTRIEDLLAESQPDDVLLLHFSCHGLKSESGELFFAARNTRPNRLSSTAISADFVRRCMQASRSRSVVLLLDCCYGGAFGKGVAVRSTGDVNVLDSFPGNRVGGGRGRAVITASNSIEYAFEGDELADDHSSRPSVFTTALVEGLATGDADRDEDGWVSLNELYDYVFDRVRAQTPHQTPSRDVEMQGELYLARSRRRRIKPQPIPADLQAAMTDANMFSRLGAVSELRSRLLSENLPAAVGAHEALVEIARTDIQYVAEPAQAAVREATLRPSATALRFEPVVSGAEPPHLVLQLLGPPVARICTPHASDDWIHVEETPEGLDISVDTRATRTGTLNLKGPTGEVDLPVTVTVLPAEQLAAPEEPPTAEEPPAAKDVPPAQKPPAPADVPSAEEPPAPADVPSAEEPPAAEDLPSAQAPSVGEQVRATEETPTVQDAPAVSGAPVATTEPAPGPAPTEPQVAPAASVSAAAPRPGRPHPDPARTAPAGVRPTEPVQPRPVESGAPPPTAQPVAAQRSGGREIGSILWALIPLLSLGLLAFVPFVHAAVRLKNAALWLAAAGYAALLVAFLALNVPAILILLIVAASIHAFVLRERVFAVAEATPVGRPAAPPATARQVPMPHFRVVALGIAGSGKTVYLSSMFHTVNVPTATRSYFLETAAAQRIYLSKVFDEVSDTAEPWPRGTRTGETRELVFDCMSFDRGTKHQVFTISYLDYAGELLETQQAAGSTGLSDLEARIRNAHGLLGMLDGYRVLQFLRGEPAGQRYFRSSIQPMTGMMAGATCPIHFVLTKWDLIRGFGEPVDADDNLRLSLVRDALMNTAQLNALVETHSWEGRIIRLIPVSAVGPDFAQMDTDGRILKLPNGQLHPANVEVPLTAILPDLFRQVEQSLDPATRQQLAADARSRHEPRFSMTAFLNLPAGATLGRRLQDVVGGSAGREVVGMFLDWMAGMPTDEARAVGEQRRDARRQAATVELARARVLGEFAADLQRLEERLPASRLGGR